MKNFHSLKKRNEFDFVFKNGKSYANRNLVMYVTENNEKNSRIGISVSKKVGKSVEWLRCETRPFFVGRGFGLILLSYFCTNTLYLCIK